ncbi:MAG: response regulator transcription factor [Solirubrobacterales bacterium]
MAAASTEAGDPDPERPRERNAIPEKPSASGVRVLIVDDHELFRRALREHLEANGVDVVGEAQDAEGAVAVATETAPEVVLMDIRMPGGSGIDATRRLLEAVPGAQVLMLTIHTEDVVIAEAIMAGASGYLLKDAGGDQILAAIAAAHSGETPLSPRIASALIRLIREREPPPATRSGELPRLTEREREVLGLIAEGRENNEIAAALVISPETVKTHVSSILEKLEADNRAQAAVTAVRAGLV